MKDGPYLLVVLFLVSIVLSVIFRVAWKTLGRPSHARTWSLAFAIGAGGYLLNAVGAALRLSSPLYVMVVSLPSLALTYLATRGYRQRAGLPMYPRRFGAGFLAVLAIMVLANYVFPHQGARLAIVPLFGAAMLFLGSQAAVRYRRKPSSADRSSAVFQLVFVCFELLLTALALRLGKGPNPSALAVYNQVLLLGLPSLYVGSGLIAMFLLTSDLALRMEHLAETDTLTALLNRRGFEREAKDAIAMAQAQKLPLTAVLADIDHFKRINDGYGHGIGDVALSRFSAYLAANVPGLVPAGRLGGEEFVFLLVGMPPDEALERVEQIRQGVASISLADYEVDPFTASFGVTHLQPEDATMADLLERADVALYQAKATGRNRVCIYDPSLQPMHVPRSERRPQTRQSELA
jgi:diguanylate cyclase (GGDEF)-like protein